MRTVDSPIPESMAGSVIRDHTPPARPPRHGNYWTILTRPRRSRRRSRRWAARVPGPRGLGLFESGGPTFYGASEREAIAKAGAWCDAADDLAESFGPSGDPTRGERRYKWGDRSAGADDDTADAAGR